jgi:hypothetical protein
MAWLLVAVGRRRITCGQVKERNLHVLLASILRPALGSLRGLRWGDPRSGPADLPSRLRYERVTATEKSIAFGTDFALLLLRIMTVVGVASIYMPTARLEVIHEGHEGHEDAEGQFRIVLGCPSRPSWMTWLNRSKQRQQRAA